MKVVLLSADLMVASRVEGAATRAGASVRLAASPSQAADNWSTEPAELLIIDLATPALDVHALVRRVKSEQAVSTRVVAFGPHVHEDRLAAARDAGCDLVMSRGQFFAAVDEVFAA